LSLKNFDIAYGFNGEPSTASLSFAVNKKTCGEGISQTLPQEEGGNILSGRSEIDVLIDDFIISSIKTSKEAGFESINYELVDREAKRLESIAVLVRGETAPPKGTNRKSFMRLYDAAEMNSGVGERGDSEPVLLAQTAFIGRTFSVLSASYEEEKAELFYHGGEIVHQAPKGTLSSQLLANLAEATPSLRYGYYLSDLKKLLEMCSYTTKNFPQDNNFILMDFGGSLKDVVGSVASLFGMYWICRGSSIEFYSSSALLAMSIPNFNQNPDPNILSSSYTRDLLGKGTVGVVVGTSDVSDSSGGDAAKSRTVNFYRIDVEKAFGGSSAWLSNFFTFFRLGTGEPAVFDNIIFKALLAEEGVGKSMVSKQFFTRFYTTKTFKNKEPQEKTKALPAQAKLEKFEEKFVNLGNYEKLISLESKEGGNLTLPSDSGVYGLLNAGCESVGSIYISRPVSEVFTNRYSVQTGDDLDSLSGPYLGSTLISDIPSLRAIWLIISLVSDEENADKKTVADLYAGAKKTGGTPVVGPNSSYYYVGLRDFLSNDDDDASKDYEKALRDVEKVMLNGSVEIFDFDNGTWLGDRDGKEKEFSDMFSSSRNIYEQLKKDGQRVIRTKAVNESGSEGESGDSSFSPKSQFKSFLITESTSPLAAVSVVKFDGNIGEAEFLDSQINNLIAPPFNQTTSSVTYSGLTIPAKSPVLTNVSVSFAGAVETSLTYSNREFIAAGQDVIMGNFKTSPTFNMRRKLSTRQKGFLGLN